jgi:hypothetical protein
MNRSATRPGWATGVRYETALEQVRLAALALVPYEYGYPGHTSRPLRPGDPPPPSEIRNFVAYRFLWRTGELAQRAACESAAGAYGALRAEILAVLEAVPLHPRTRRELMVEVEVAIWRALRPRT